MRKKRNVHKLNNRGVTLVELLVAMTILSLVVVVFYNGFIVAAKTNAKAKLQHKATSLAQNIMEGLKAENMDSIMQQFVYPTYASPQADGSVETGTNFDILPSNITGALSSDNIGCFPGPTDPAYAVSTDGGKTAKYQKSSDGKYYLYLRNLKMENTVFDALITIDGSAYMKPESGTSTSGQNYNSEEIVQIANMDVYYDAVASNAITYDGEALSRFPLSYDSSKVQRIIKIDVKETLLLSGNIQQTVNVTYRYEYDGVEKYTEEDLVFDNVDDLNKQLRNIFLFYPPSYDWKQDIIEINYPKDREFEFYVIKQQTITDPAELRTNDAAYKASLRINAVGEVTPNTSTPSVKIRTNLGYNLYDGSNIVSQASYQFCGINVLSPADKFDIGTLTNKQTTDKIMDVTVAVYLHNPDAPDTAPASKADFLDPSNIGEKKAELTGTIRN